VIGDSPHQKQGQHREGKSKPHLPTQERTHRYSA
jgi:hypothetical protein